MVSANVTGVKGTPQTHTGLFSVVSESANGGLLAGIADWLIRFFNNHDAILGHFEHLID
jgi:hypothetical protein